MRSSKTLAKLREGKPVRICALGHFIPPYIRLAAASGFDCIWLDLEHRAFDPREVQSLLAFFHLFDVDCMLRPATIEKTPLYRYLEDGASGLMIPHVSTPERAEEIVRSVRFPPEGDRGLDGAGLDSDFIFQGGEPYPPAANRETFLVVQIETPEAIDNVEAIAAIPGVDGLFVGPGDLGLRLRQLAAAATLDDAIEHVAAAASKHGKAWGSPVATSEQLRSRREQGAQLLARGGDFMALKEALERWAADFDECGDA